MPGPPATYFRLLAGELLPSHVTKAIYLDAGVLVIGDLSVLWKMDLKGSLALAVPDAYAKAFHLRRLSRVAFSEKLLLNLQTPYFNAGVIVMDVEGWRKADVGERAIRLLEDHGQSSPTATRS